MSKRSATPLLMASFMMCHLLTGFMHLVTLASVRFANQPLAMSGNVNAVNKDKARALSTQLTSARAADSNALGIIGETNRLY